MWDLTFHELKKKNQYYWYVSSLTIFLTFKHYLISFNKMSHFTSLFLNVKQLTFDTFSSATGALSIKQAPSFFVCRLQNSDITAPKEKSFFNKVSLKKIMHNSMYSFISDSKFHQIQKKKYCSDANICSNFFF